MLTTAADLRHEQWSAKVWLGAEEGSNTEHHGPTFGVNQVSLVAYKMRVDQIYQDITCRTCNLSQRRGFVLGALPHHSTSVIRTELGTLNIVLKTYVA